MTLTSSGNRLYIRFSSDGAVGKRGFNASYNTTLGKPHWFLLLLRNSARINLKIVALGVGTCQGTVWSFRFCLHYTTEHTKQHLEAWARRSARPRTESAKTKLNKASWRCEADRRMTRIAKRSQNQTPSIPCRKNSNLHKLRNILPLVEQDFSSTRYSCVKVHNFPCLFFVCY